MSWLIYTTAYKVWWGVYCFEVVHHSVCNTFVSANILRMIDALIFTRSKFGLLGVNFRQFLIELCPLMVLHLTSEFHFHLIS